MATASSRIIQTRDFTKQLRDLARTGKRGKDIVTKVRAALHELGTESEVTTLSRTKHGETRLKHVEKYDLGDGCRLVVQELRGADHTTYACLFVGTHDETDEWLENHKNYKWVKRDSDKTLEFIPVTQGREQLLPRQDIQSPESTLTVPLLRGLSDEQWAELSVPVELVEYARRVTTEAWESDCNGVLDHVSELSDEDASCLFIDLFTLAHEQKWEQLHDRVSLRAGKSRLPNARQAASLLLKTENSEHVVTWEEVESLPAESTWAEWLLFLHPEQKRLATMDFAGPARLRGVTGSGKTCVMVHRARHLAKKYQRPIQLVTLTESMRKLLDSLIKDLCGVEQAYIRTSTMNRLAEDVIEQLHPRGLSAYSRLDRNGRDIQLQRLFERAKSEKSFAKSVLSRLEDGQHLRRFLDEEVTYIRTRLAKADYDEYLDPKRFRRYGRGIPLSRDDRALCLSLTRYWDEQLLGIRQFDHEEVVQMAVALVRPDVKTLKYYGFTESQIGGLVTELQRKMEDPELGWPRCVLVDEVQDLSQLEISLLSVLPSPPSSRIGREENGLLLVGDGAQTVYKRGFSLSRSEIEIRDRSYVLTKNYRNSREIMDAAYQLINKYEFADIDEDNTCNPVKPDLAVRHGELPYLVKCDNLDDQLEFVAWRVSEILNERASLIGDGEEAQPLQICVIGLRHDDRSRARYFLEQRNVATTEIRDDFQIGGPEVKLSTIESAKGYEFEYVFIVNLIDGAIPLRYTQPEELGQQAARLYVAMTRARDGLYMTYSVSTRERPSRFLADIQSKCAEVQYRNGRLFDVRR